MALQDKKTKVEEFAGNDWRTIGFWISMVAAGLLAGFVFGWCWRDRAGALSNVRILDVLIAIGTIGAVVAALGLHFHREGRDNKNSLLKAKLYALDKRVQLQYINNLSKKISKINFSLTKLGRDSNNNELQKLAAFAVDFQRAYDNLNLRLEDLAPLKKGIAKNLAVGLSQAHQGVNALQSFLRIASSLDDKQFQNQVITNHVWLSGGAAILDTGFNHLSDVASDFFIESN